MTPGSVSGYVKLSKYVGIDNQDRCLLMRGCPWTVTEGEIVQFFDGYGKLASQEVFIEVRHGKRTGSVLVILETKKFAQAAKAALHK